MMLYENICSIIEQAKSTTYRAIHAAIVHTYWEIGRLIVEEEQAGAKKAAYGQQILKETSEKLTKAYGEGYSIQSLRSYRQFYAVYPIRSTLCSELSWSHYRLLMRVSNQATRIFTKKRLSKVTGVSEQWSDKLTVFTMNDC